MKAMKGLSMGKMLDSIKRKPGDPDDSPDPSGDHPDAVAARCVKQFVTSGGPGASDDEVTFLPPIVDAAESSPAAAAECARLIRKYLHRDYWSKPSYQYNAIMLLRILADNPGPTFTRNIDKKFVDAAKELLRSGRDLSVRQMLMETLDTFESTKAYDEGLAGIIELWKKEKDKALKAYGSRGPPPLTGPRPLNAPPFDPHSQNYFARSHHKKGLPTPAELASRLEEARTSSKLLEQVVACTPPSEVLSNDLIKEFADRCLSASRSIQGYMVADDPPPDNDTMESLIDTNEQLQQALNQHQRAVLNARKQLGLGERSNDPSPAPPDGAQQPARASPALPGWPQAGSQASSSRSDLSPPLPALPARKPIGNGKGKATELSDSVVSRSSSTRPRPDGSSQNGNVLSQGAGGPGAGADDDQDPFRDPQPEPFRGGGAGGKASAGGGSMYTSELPEAPRLAFEPFHPGFTTTPSYLGRQESAVGKVAMHGGGGVVPEDEGAAGVGDSGVEPGSVVRGSNSAPEEEEDLYAVTPTKKEAVYRY